MKAFANSGLAAVGSFAILWATFVPNHPGETAVSAAYTSFWSGSETGLSQFREALRSDPASPFRWCDLAEASLEARDLTTARYCRTRALELGPNVPAILLRTANLSWLLGDPNAAFESSRRTLDLTVAYEAAIFENYRRFGDVEGVLRFGFSPKSAALQRYAQYLDARNASPNLSEAVTSKVRR